MRRRLQSTRQPRPKTAEEETEEKVIIDIHHLPIERNGSLPHRQQVACPPDTLAAEAELRAKTRCRSANLRCNLVNEHKMEYAFAVFAWQEGNYVRLLLLLPHNSHVT